jgi:predicted nucleotidyltransferase
VDLTVRAWSAEQARHRPDLQRLGYFGSYARNDWGVGSDLDLIAVVDDISEPFERRSLNWNLSSLPVPSEIVVYTDKEFEDLQKKNTRFGRLLKSEVVWTFLRRS